MLGIDDQSEQQTGDERGRYPGFFERQGAVHFEGEKKEEVYALGERVLGGAELGRVGAYGAWFGAAVYGEDDRAEPRADHPSDHLPLHVRSGNIQENALVRYFLAAETLPKSRLRARCLMMLRVEFRQFFRRARSALLVVLDQEAEIVVKPGIALDSEWRDRAGLNGCGPAEGSYMKHCTEGHTNTSVFVGTAYSQTLSASGTAPYIWTIAKGALPGGLSLDASSGSISVTPTAAGTSSVTIQVTDSTKATASAAFTLTVMSASFSGLSSTATAAQQLSGTLAPGAAYPQEITGQVTLAFQPDASLASPADDPSIQFSTGGRTASFTIPANSTAPVPFSLQTGTVAGNRIPSPQPHDLRLDVL